MEICPPISCARRVSKHLFIFVLFHLVFYKVFIILQALTYLFSSFPNKKIKWCNVLYLNKRNILQQFYLSKRQQMLRRKLKNKERRWFTIRNWRSGDVTSTHRFWHTNDKRHFHLSVIRHPYIFFEQLQYVFSCIAQLFNRINSGKRLHIWFYFKGI